MGCCGGRVKAAAQLLVKKTKKAPAASKELVSKEAQEQSALEPPEPPLVPEATKTE